MLSAIETIFVGCDSCHGPYIFGRKVRLLGSSVERTYNGITTATTTDDSDIQTSHLCRRKRCLDCIRIQIIQHANVCCALVYKCPRHVAGTASCEVQDACGGHQLQVSPHCWPLEVHFEVRAGWTAVGLEITCRAALAVAA